MNEGGGRKAEGGNRDLRSRTKDYALRIVRLYRALPRRDGVAEVIGKQLLRSGTSVAVWLELLGDSETVVADRLTDIRRETDELIAIFVTMTNNVKKRQRE